MDIQGANRHNLILSTAEPHLEFFRSFVWKDYRFWKIGDGFYYLKEPSTFHGLLEYIAVTTLGQKWLKIQLGMDYDKQHILHKWAAQYLKFKEKHSNDTYKKADGVFEAPSTGPAKSWLMFGYDLLCLSHKKALSVGIINKLKENELFQGARYEISVAAILIIAGCDIEWIDPNSRKSRSPELIASHRKTGFKFAVEAKSKKRPGMYNQPGSWEQELKGAASLIKEAIEQGSEDLPFVIFVDLNIPRDPKLPS